MPERQQFDYQNHERRKGPQLDPELWQVLTDIRDRGARMERTLEGMNTAFVKDDLGRPDYDGHRRAHAAMQKQSETIENFKMDATKKVLLTLVGVLAGLVASGLITQIKTILAGG